MKTLYVSDLYGTLLRSNESTSEFTNEVINKLTEQGMIFSYATARSLVTAKKVTRGMREFLEGRKGDVRRNPVRDTASLIQGDCFYITCIDEPEKLEPLYQKFKDTYHCVYQRDIYTNEQWLEIMPETACKSNAVMQLRELLKCDRLVVFGDGKNDIDMFDIADECYAVENAVTELKERATAVIQGNDEDGVAKWLERNFCLPK